MNSIVKPMEPKDLETVRRLSQELGYPATKEEFEVRYHELRALPHHRLLVVVDKEVQGWIHLEIVLDLIETKKIEIKALIINENSRGKGLGTKLVQAAQEWARETSLDTIYLSCNIVRDKAHAFYLQQGFKKHKTSYFFELNI